LKEKIDTIIPFYQKVKNKRLTDVIVANLDKKQNDDLQNMGFI